MFNKKILSIDIGASKIKFVIGSHQKNLIIIEKSIVVDTPKDCIHDGKILDSKLLVSCIEKTLKDNSIKEKNVTLTIHSTAIINREMVMPYIAKDELDGAVRLQIEQYLPVALDDYDVEYKILEDFTENNEKKIRILIAALPKDITKSYLEVVNTLKLIPVSLDFHSNCISKLFIGKQLFINGENFSQEKTVAFIDLGYSSLIINIISNDVLRFSRYTTNGCKDIDINIANAMNTTIEEAEKQRLNDGKLIISDSDFSRLNNIITASVNTWIQDIQRVFQYHTSRNNQNRIDAVFLYGGGAYINSICEYFSQLLNINTSKIESISSIKYTGEKDDLVLYLNSAGSLFRIK